MAHKKCPHKTFVCSQHLSWLSAQNYLRSSHNPLVAITWISMGAHKPPSTGNYTIVCKQAVEHTLGQPMKTEGGCPSGREFQNCHMQNSSPKGWVQLLPFPYNTHRQTSAYHHKRRNAEKEKEKKKKRKKLADLPWQTGCDKRRRRSPQSLVQWWRCLHSADWQTPHTDHHAPQRCPMGEEALRVGECTLLPRNQGNSCTHLWITSCHRLHSAFKWTLAVFKNAWPTLDIVPMYTGHCGEWCTSRFTHRGKHDGAIWHPKASCSTFPVFPTLVTCTGWEFEHSLTQHFWQ